MNKASIFTIAFFFSFFSYAQLGEQGKIYIDAGAGVGVYKTLTNWSEGNLILYKDQ